MNKFLILSILTALNVQGAVVTVTAAPVVVTAGGDSGSYNAGQLKAAATSAIASATPRNVYTDNTSSSSGSSSSSSGSGGLDVSQDEFMKAWTQGKLFLPDPNVPAPTAAQYEAFIKNAGPMGGITSRTELAMFLAEIMWESGGLYYKSELACKDNNCVGSYVDNVGLPGKYYFGRGYIQLTWGANYKEASNSLFKDDRLLKEPESVATNEDYAWGVSYWYWNAKVKPTLAGTFKFGLATKAINGALECSGANTDKATKRFKIYTEILKVFEPSSTPIESGCYN